MGVGLPVLLLAEGVCLFEWQEAMVLGIFGKVWVKGRFEGYVCGCDGVRLGREWVLLLIEKREEPE